MVSHQEDKPRVSLSTRLDDMLKQNAKDCKGLIFRFRRSQHVGSRGDVVFTDKFIPLKKKSCSGCNNCGWYQDFLDYAIGEYPCNAIVIPDTIQDGDTCILDITNESTDWETGLVDDWDYEFKVIKPERKNLDGTSPRR